MLKSKPALLRALAATVIESLQSEGSAEIPGLGRLFRVHVPASSVTDADGTVRLTPPHERVAFEPAPGERADRDA